jgi:hypothetical protein
MSRRAPISLLLNPSNTPRSTARSRSVKSLLAGSSFGLRRHLHNVAQASLVHPRLASVNFANRLRQQRRGAVLEKQPRGSFVQNLHRFRRRDARGHHQHSWHGSERTGAHEKIWSALRTQIVVEKNQVDMAASQNLNRLIDRGTIGHHLEIRLRVEQSAQALPKQGVVVQQ